MHDSHLVEKISRSVIGLCAEKKIYAINELCVSVHKNSHVTAETLLNFIKDVKGSLVGEETYIRVLKDQIQENTALIRFVDGYAENQSE
jgi:hypothetical protein